VLTDDQIIEQVRRALTADTAGIDPLPGLRDRVRRELAGTRGERRGRGRPRLRTDAIVVALAGAVAAGIALVALVLLHHDPRSRPNPPAGPVPGTVLIAAHAPDPHGDLPWGLRMTQTRRLRACLQIGRLRAGRIGALGQDGAFADDGRFHPIPAGTNFPCAGTDARGRLFLNVFERELPASAAAGDTPGCLVSPSPRLQRHEPAHRRSRTCPTRDLRNVAFGMLGPDAVSVTYAIAGHSVTAPTGPDGGYLVVVPGTSLSCIGGRCLGGNGEITTRALQAGIITAVRYRDGHVCRLPAPTARGVAPGSCPSAGFAKYPPFHPPHVTPEQVRAAVTPSFVVGTRFCYRPQRHVFNPIDVPCEHGVPPGFRPGLNGQRTLLIHLRFVARLAADNHHSVYEWSLGRASGPACSGSGGGVSATTMVPIRADRRVVLQDNEQPCPGAYEGVITYQPNGYPGRDTVFWASPIRDGSTIVGRFRFVVR
jgi:hypothetical protein